MASRLRSVLLRSRVRPVSLLSRARSALGRALADGLWTALSGRRPRITRGSGLSRIAGGYREERRLGNRLVSRVVAPLSFNFIGADDFHRVELLEHDAWSLFLVGPKVASWSFWDPRTGELTPWREFIAKKRAGAS